MEKTIGKLMVSAAVAILAIGLWAAGARGAENRIVLKLAHFMPTMHVQHREAFVPFAEAVAEKTGGRVRVEIFPGGSLGNPRTMVDAVAAGIADIGFVLPSYVPGRFPRSSVFELPFILEALPVSESEKIKSGRCLWSVSVKDLRGFENLGGLNLGNRTDMR